MSYSVNDSCYCNFTIDMLPAKKQNTISKELNAIKIQKIKTMKKLSFTVEEKKLLHELIPKQLEFLSNQTTNKSSHNNIITKLKKALIYLLENISKNDLIKLSEWHKTAVISCIINHYTLLKKELNLEMFNEFSWLSLSEQQRKTINIIDNCKNILCKCGCYDFSKNLRRVDEEFRYKDIISTIDKLRSSNKIFISMTQSEGVNKIAFVNNDSELFTIVLTNRLSLREMRYASIDGKCMEQFGKSHFSMITNKADAKTLIEISNQKFYCSNTLEFVNVLLS